MIARTSFRIAVGVAAVALLAGVPAQASQPNDSFEHAERVTSLPFHQVVVPSAATLEEDEPSPSCSIAAGSVWYRLERWSPASVVITGEGDSAGTFIAVWEGDSLASLHERACDDDAWGARPSQLSFVANPGAVYHIQVGPTWGAGDGASIRIIVSQGAVASTGPGRDGAEIGVAGSADEVIVGGDASADHIGVELQAGQRAGRASAGTCVRAWNARTCSTAP